MKRISKKNEDMFRLVLENNPYPMWIYDHQTLQFREVNPAAIAKYGYTREEFLKMKITEIRPQDQVPRLLREHKKFRMDLKHIGEWQHLVKDGFGLVSMTERAQRIGSKLTLTSKQGKGSKIVVNVRA